RGDAGRRRARDVADLRCRHLSADGARQREARGDRRRGARRMTTAVRVPVVRLRADATLPSYMSPGAAGLDLAAALDDPVTIAPGMWMLVPTGIAIALPAGYEGQVRPRSGLAQRTGLTVLNAPGTIDSDYRGEIQVLLVNLGRENAVVRGGDR